MARRRRPNGEANKYAQGSEKRRSKDFDTPLLENRRSKEFDVAASRESLPLDEQRTRSRSRTSFAPTVEVMDFAATRGLSKSRPVGLDKAGDSTASASTEASRFRARQAGRRAKTAEVSFGDVKLAEDGAMYSSKSKSTSTLPRDWRRKTTEVNLEDLKQASKKYRTTSYEQDSGGIWRRKTTEVKAEDLKAAARWQPEALRDYQSPYTVPTSLGTPSTTRRARTLEVNVSDVRSAEAGMTSSSGYKSPTGDTGATRSRKPSRSVEKNSCLTLIRS